MKNFKINKTNLILLRKALQRYDEIMYAKKKENTTNENILVEHYNEIIAIYATLNNITWLEAYTILTNIARYDYYTKNSGYILWLVTKCIFITEKEARKACISELKYYLENMV